MGDLNESIFNIQIRNFVFIENEFDMMKIENRKYRSIYIVRS